MDPTLLTSLIVSLSLLLVVGFVAAGAQRRQVRLRMGRMVSGTGQRATRSGSPRQSLEQARAALRRLGAPLALRVPRGGDAALQLRLARAGLSNRVDASLYYGSKAGMAVVVLVIGLLVVFTHWPPNTQLLAPFVLLALLGWLVPDLLLRLRIGSRRQAIYRALPTTLDLLALMLGAGMGFEQAVILLTEQSEGPLAEELRRFLADLNLGTLRRDGLRGMAERSNLADVRALVLAIEQAEELGASLVPVVAAQASHLRALRQRRAEAEAQRAPIRMIVPMVLFILPVLFLVILGPVGIRLAENASRAGG